MRTTDEIKSIIKLQLGKDKEEKNPKVKINFSPFIPEITLNKSFEMSACSPNSLQSEQKKKTHGGELKKKTGTKRIKMEESKGHTSVAWPSQRIPGCVSPRRLPPECQT
jgi:hypothetical protein